MAKKSGETSPWHELELQAYHAFREWHIWLVLRQRELDEHLGAKKPHSPPPAQAKQGDK